MEVPVAVNSQRLSSSLFSYGDKSYRQGQVREVVWRVSPDTTVFVWWKDEGQKVDFEEQEEKAEYKEPGFK